MKANERMIDRNDRRSAPKNSTNNGEIQSKPPDSVTASSSSTAQAPCCNNHQHAPKRETNHLSVPAWKQRDRTEKAREAHDRFEQKRQQQSKAVVAQPNGFSRPQKQRQRQVSSSHYLQRLQTLGLVLIMIASGTFYLRPDYVDKIIRWWQRSFQRRNLSLAQPGSGVSPTTFANPSPNQQHALLPMRHILTMYPIEAHVNRQLPRFLYNYALATSHNTLARETLRELHRKRTQLAQAAVVADLNATGAAPAHHDSFPPTKQSHQYHFLHAWEQDDFQRQLNGTNMDLACGPGFHDAYANVVRLVQRDAQASKGQRVQELLDDLVMWCLLDSHSQDAVIKWDVELETLNVSTINYTDYDGDTDPTFWTNALTHGRIHGIAGQYWGQPRIHSSLLWLHMLTAADYHPDPKFRRRISSPLANNTVLPFLIQFAQGLNVETNQTDGTNTQLQDYPRVLEHYLYQQIQQEIIEKDDASEDNPWILLTVVCDQDDGGGNAVTDTVAAEAELRKKGAKRVAKTRTGTECRFYFLPQGESDGSCQNNNLGQN